MVVFTYVKHYELKEDVFSFYRDCIFDVIKVSKPFPTQL